MMSDNNDLGALPQAAGLSPTVEPLRVSSPDGASIPNAGDVPDYPFWQATEVDATFGADASRYVNRYDAGDIARKLRKEAKAGSDLFFCGGRLADHGLQWRPEIAAQRPMLTLQALLCSFAPPHEAKEATVALALHHWCEPLPAEGR